MVVRVICNKFDTFVDLLSRIAFEFSQIEFIKICRIHGICRKIVIKVRSHCDDNGYGKEWVVLVPVELFTWGPASMAIEFFTIAVSVRLSDRSLHREEQKKIRQKLPPVGIETRTSGSLDQCLTN